MTSLIVVGAIALFVLITVFKGVRIVPQGEEWIVERLGRYHSTLKPGLNIVIPYMDVVAYRLPTKDIILDVQQQEIITKDNAVIVANALCFAKVVDPQKASYGVQNFSFAVTSLTMTSLRAIVGAMDLDEALSSREQEVLELIARGFSYAEIARIKAMTQPPKVLVLTSQLPEAYSLRCMQAGAMGFVAKTDELDELGKAVRATLSGYTYFPEVALSSVHKQDLKFTDAQCIASLTDRELMILQQLARGLSNKAIGEAMLLSNKTISTYKTRLMEKLRVNSLIDLADFARRNALI